MSFGFTDALWHFWQQCGFELVRMGSHREASSGCYTAMALLPQSEAGHRLCEQARLRLHRDARVLSLWNGERSRWQMSGKLPLIVTTGWSWQALPLHTGPLLRPLPH